MSDDQQTNYSGDDYGYKGTNWSQIPVSGASTYSMYNISSDYQPTPPPDDGSIFKNEYDYVDNELSGPAQSIQKIRLRIKSQQPGDINALGDWWLKAAQLLDQIWYTVASNAESLHNGDAAGFGGWSSPAADEFLRWGPGATLYCRQTLFRASKMFLRACCAAP